MEPLSRTINLLFAKRKGSDVLEDLVKSNFKKDVSEECDDRWWKETFALNYHHETFDHALSYFSLLRDIWEKPMDDDGILKYSSRQTIFNVLLHFTRPLLVEKGKDFNCRYSSLLRWHSTTAPIGEDLFTCAFLASKDLKSTNTRKEFLWEAFLNHDNRALNNVLSRPKADIHLHLQGSSLNFDINWLSLMNNMAHRHDVFKHFPDMELLMYKAFAIRLFLFCEIYEKGVVRCEIKNILKENSLLVVKRLYSKLAEIANILKQKATKINGNAVDYAIRNKALPSGNMICLFSGERSLLYYCMQGIYAGTYDKKPLCKSLFYIYILLKTEMRNVLLQMNDIQGFGNFDDYEKRKVLFAKFIPTYSKLVIPTVLSTSMSHKNTEDYLELRIAPQRTIQETRLQIKNTVNAIEETLCKEKLKTKYGFVYHFIKREEKHKTNENTCRHASLREQVKRQALIINFWRSTSKHHSLLKGIDAANSEIYCRPEVFAQAFRYLKNHVPERFNRSNSERLPALGMTYHVGEDYLDIVDGLRGIDEVLHFMNFDNGDRLGHALALGVSVPKFYESHQLTIALPVQELFDNIVWLSFKASHLPSFPAVSNELDVLFQKYRINIYGSGNTNDKFDFY